MRNIVIALIAALAICTITCSQQPSPKPNRNPVSPAGNSTTNSAKTIQLNSIKPVPISELEIPATVPGDIVIRHTGYSFVYSEPYEQSKWVAYELTKEETQKVVDRKDNFIPDPLVTTKTANKLDYYHSGYDRGHMAPAADMLWSTTAMQESFYFSNMSPQLNDFNNGIWKKLEEQVRTWAIQNEAVYIVTGPVLIPGLPTIGADQVAVPKYYYKVILDYTDPDVKAIGFIMPNADVDGPLQKYAVSVDSVEKFTGIDFFPKLPDNEERIIEKTLCIKCWTWPQ